MNQTRWRFRVAIVVFLVSCSMAMAEDRHFVGVGFDVAIVDSDTFFNEEDHIGFSVFGKYGFTDRWGLFLFYRDMEDDEDLFVLIGLEQTYEQVGARGVYVWRPKKKVRPHIGLGLVRTDFDADFGGMGVLSDDGVGLSVSGGLQAGRGRVAFYGEYEITGAELDRLDPDGTSLSNLTVGVVFRF